MISVGNSFNNCYSFNKCDNFHNYYDISNFSYNEINNNRHSRRLLCPVPYSSTCMGITGRI